MLSFTLTMSLFTAAQGVPPEIELFAKEAWYKDTKAPVTNFTGVLRKAERGKFQLNAK